MQKDIFDDHDFKIDSLDDDQGIRYIITYSKKLENLTSLQKRERLNDINNEFYVIATNLDKSVQDVLNIFSRQNRMKQLFKNMSFGYSCYNDKQRNLYFLICFTALLIFRFLACELKDVGCYITMNSIIRIMQNMEMIKEDDHYYRALYSNSAALEALEKCFCFGLQKRYFHQRTFKQILEKYTYKKVE